MSNIYYEPERHGLAVVAEIDYSSRNYEFDTRVVWQHVETGAFYTARDSGCSCPTPFERFASIAELDRPDSVTLRAEVTTELNSEWGHISPEESDGFFMALKKAGLL